MCLVIRLLFNMLDFFVVVVVDTWRGLLFIIDSTWVVVTNAILDTRSFDLARGVGS